MVLRSGSGVEEPEFPETALGISETPGVAHLTACRIEITHVVTECFSIPQ